MFYSPKRIWLACLLLAVLGVRPVFGFTPLGPQNEAFQIDVIGYFLNPVEAAFEDDGNAQDIGCPKNLGEEYRYNTRTLYYAYDTSFLDYFGSNGVAAVDAAFAIMNSLSNVSSYSTNLAEWPRKTSRINYTAQSLQLLDLRSAMLGALVEELGLASPDRWTWCLHDRDTRGTCPNYAYTIIKRNFDPIGFTNSSYVNGVFYDYFIEELCPLPAPPAPLYGNLQADAVEFAVDPSQVPNQFSAVASEHLEYGQFYTALTRDDIGGLRYLLATNRMNVEAVEPNSLLLSTNKLSQLLNTLDLGLLSQRAMTSPPAVLQGFYTNLVITSFTNFFTNVVTTNVQAFYVTNAAFPYTNGNPSLVLITNYTTNIVTMYNYTFGNVVTNHVYTNEFLVTQTTNATPNPFAPILITNQFSQLLPSQDLSLMTEQALTNTPANFQTAYPGILITGYTNFFTNEVTTNIEAFYVTNGSFPFTNNSPSLVLITNYTTNIVTNYNYTFANVVTNHFHSNSIIVTQVTNAAPNPFAPILITNQFSQLLPSQDLGLLTLQALTNSPAGLLGIYPNLIITSYTNFFTNQVTTNIEAFYMTNPAPPFTNSGLVLITNYTTNVVTNYNYTFANVVTNHFHNNSTVVTQTTNAAPNPFAPVLVTNQFSQLLTTSNLWQLSQDSLTNNPAALQGLYPNLVILGYTNTFTNIAVPHPFAYFTNSSPGVAGASPVLVVGTNFTTNVVMLYNYYFGNVVTNHYYTNGYITTQITNIEPQLGVAGGPLVTNVITKTVLTNRYILDTNGNNFNGDYYIVPTNLWGYDIIYTQLVTVIPITNTVLIATNLPGVTNTTGQSFTENFINYFTNYNYIVYPITAFPGPIQTNITSVTNFGGTVSGDFYIIPTNLYGYDILSTQLVSVVATTNLFVVATNGPGVTNSPYVNFTLDVVTFFTNYDYVVYPIDAFPGPVQTNVTSVTNFGPPISGDFYVIPTNLFAYDILSTQLVSVVSTTNTVVIATNGPGVNATNNGFNFTEQIITFFTNYDYVVYPVQAFAGPVQTNVTSVTNMAGAINGDFYIIPAGIYNYDILSTQLVTVVATTNTIVTAVNGPGVTNNNINFTEQVVTYSTNYTLVEYPIQYVAGSVALREGIEKINFVRQDYDSLLNNFWQPQTNFYTLTAVTNGAAVVQTFKRVITQPDILIQAADLTSGPSAPIAISSYGRSQPIWNQSNRVAGLAGPGTITPGFSVTFNKVGPVFYNFGPFFLVNGTAIFPQTNSILDFLWGSFDGSTNAPTVYPDTVSMANLETQVFFQITLSNNNGMLPSASISTNSAGNPYVVQLSATGGSPPYTWSIVPGSGGLPNGLQIWPGGVISGVPTTQGTFDFTVQATDSGGLNTQSPLFINVGP